MVERLTKDRGRDEDRDPLSGRRLRQAGLAGVQKALDKRSMTLAREGTFERNTVAVKAALLAIKKGEPEAVIMVGPYKPCAEFIKLARQIKLDATFVNISFVGSDALAKELGPAGAGVVVTQVVPFPNDASIPLVARYQAALKAVLPTPSRASSRLRATWPGGRSSPRSKRSAASPPGKRWPRPCKKPARSISAVSS